MVPVLGSIANAINDAVGVRNTELSIAPSTRSSLDLKARHRDRPVRCNRKLLSPPLKNRCATMTVLR
jgi:hypothetical protein